MAKWYELKLTARLEMEEALKAFAGEKGWSHFTRLWPKENTCELLSYFKRRYHAENAKKKLTQFLKQTNEWGLRPGKPHWRLSQKEDWVWIEKSLREFVPKKISRHIVIKPTWKKYEPKEWETVIEINPQMAFGTGHHFTTRFCLQMLDKWGSEAQSVLDIGCGSGILAATAAKLYSVPVKGIDNDPLAVKTSRMNSKLNGVSRRAHFKTAEIKQFKSAPAGLVFGNLTSGVLLSNKKKIISFVKKGGVLIVTGIMRREAKKFLNEFHSAHIKLIDEKHSRFWSGFVFKKV